jgi:hypothetical protein
VTVPAAAYRARQTEAVIVIPMLPPRSCSPNSRSHWRERHADVSTFRDCAYLSALAWANAAENEWAIRGAEVIVMDAEIHWCCRRRSVDSDNAWAMLKSCRDGIADALFGGEDKHIRVGTLTQRRGEGLVRVTLRGAG